MKVLFTGLFFFFFVFASYAQLVQWRGPARDGIFTASDLLTEWPENGPEQILEVEKIGKGWSSPILAGDMIYVTGMIDTLDYLTAVDLAGNIKWQVAYGRSWNQSFPDTRCTPVVEDNRIYVQSGTGRVACIDKDSGKEIWAKEVDKEFNVEYHLWGNSETPLIVDDKLICSPGEIKPVWLHSTK
ncbi:MAG: PQQ-binding-like beta-propeller repeat protein [Mariniphaga sp.]